MRTGFASGAEGRAAEVNGRKAWWTPARPITALPTHDFILASTLSRCSARSLILASARCPQNRNQRRPSSAAKVRGASRPIPWAVSHMAVQPEIQQNYSRLQGDLQALASKIGDLEQDAEEHQYALPRL